MSDLESERQALWEIARIHRDRSFDSQHSIAPGRPDWEPDDDEPRGDVERFWYLQGKAEAFASIMSECESMKAEHTGW